MGRTSSTGLPFLISRPDSGQYAYFRSLARDVAPLVTGSVSLAWRNGHHELTGRTTIKLSFGTGDLETARVRWAHLHPQVDALVRLAQMQVDRRTAGPEQAHPRLSRDQVLAMAGQVTHDLLAADDRALLDPTFTSPVADLLLRLSRQAGFEDAQAAELSRRAAVTMERRIAKGRLARRNVTPVDASIQELEVNAPAGFLNEDGSLATGGRLTPEQIEALAGGVRIGEIPGEVEALLVSNGIVLPKDHPDRRTLALALTRGKVQALNSIEQRGRGEPIETPPRPARVELAPAASIKPSLSQMRDRWIGMKRPGTKQRDDNARYLRLFVSQNGDLPVDQITKDHVRAFRDKLMRCPRNAPKSLSDAPIDSLVAWADKHPGKRKLGRGTINSKALGALSALLATAMDDGHVVSNMTEGQKLPIGDDDVLDREPYTAEKLNAIFRTGIYADQPRIPKAAKGAAGAWLPLLGLFTGARLEELGQLLVTDIRIQDGIPVVVIDDRDTLEDVLAKAAAGKSVKTKAGRRWIPIHAELIRLGFLDFVERPRASGFNRLFPELTYYRERCTKDWSKWWGRWSGKHVTDDPAYSYHSLRHNFIEELRRLKVPEPIIKALVGHAISDTTSKYGRRKRQAYDVATLNGELQRLSFPGLEIGHLVHVPALSMTRCA